MNEFILRKWVCRRSSNSNKRSRNATMELIFSLPALFFYIHLTFLDTHFSPKFACNHNNIDLGSFVPSFLFAIFLFCCCRSPVLVLCIAQTHCLLALLYFPLLLLLEYDRILAVFMRFIRSRSHYAQLHTSRHSDECRRMCVRCGALQSHKNQFYMLRLTLMHTITIYLSACIECRNQNTMELISVLFLYSFYYWKCVCVESKSAASVNWRTDNFKTKILDERIRFNLVHLNNKMCCI